MCYNQFMKNYDFVKDISRITRLYNMTQEDLAKNIGVTRMSISRYLKGDSFPSREVLEKFYSFIYNKELYLNQSKATFYFEDRKDNELLFHGASMDIVGEVDNKHSILPNDFGSGFYAGMSLNQAASWVSEKENGSVYCFYFKHDASLKKLSFELNRDWMYAILYYRGAFKNFEPSKEVLDLVKRIEECDYLIAPIADNQMYQTINQFADNMITDEACVHALSATNLGLQYVFKSMKAINCLVPIDRFYLCEKEKNDYKIKKDELAKQSQSKAELAKIEYRREGKYFDEIFKKS